VRATAGTGVEHTRARATQSIGIEVFGGRAVVLIGAGAKAPVARTMTFTTVADGQRAIEVRVVRCLSGRPAGPAIGRFVLAGVRPAPRGEARIDIGLSLDQEGLLRAWGADRSSGARQESSFPGAWALSSAGRVDALRALMTRLEEAKASLGSSGLAVPSTDRETALATLAGEIACVRRSLVRMPILAAAGDAHAS
jgi:molecular chaperone DnaK (HSP70)